MFVAQNRRRPDIVLLSFPFFVDPEDYQPPIWKSYCKYFNVFLTLYMYGFTSFECRKLDPVDRLHTILEEQPE